MQRLGELQTIRAGIVSSLTEWKNRCGSGLADDTALALVKATITHFAAQLAEVDKAIAGTIDNDPDLSAKRDLLLSISGVGEVLAGLVLCELPGTDVLQSSSRSTIRKISRLVSPISRSPHGIGYVRECLEQPDDSQLRDDDGEVAPHQAAVDKIRARVAELAVLDEIKYQIIRKAEAKKLGITVELSKTRRLKKGVNQRKSGRASGYVRDHRAELAKSG